MEGTDNQEEHEDSHVSFGTARGVLANATRAGVGLDVRFSEVMGCNSCLFSTPSHRTLGRQGTGETETDLTGALLDGVSLIIELRFSPPAPVSIDGCRCWRWMAR